MTKSKANDSTIAVIIAAYNAERTIARAINSALLDACVSEVVVIDDASSDSTVQEARRFEGETSRVKVISLPKNSGPSVARNEGIIRSRSAWITILDADDYILHDRFEAMLKASDNADIIADDLWQVNEGHEDTLEHTLLDHNIRQIETVSLSDFVIANVSKRGRLRGELGFVKPLIRRAFMNAHNVRYQEHMRLGEDYELYARLLAHGARFLIMPPQGYVSVMRPNSLSGRHSALDLLNLRECNVELAKMPSLTANEIASLRKHYLSIDCRLQWRNMIRAFREKNCASFFSALFRPWPVPAYLTGQLLKQIALRSVSFAAK